MARLSIALLGTFEVVLDDRPVTAFEYDKVRALFAYLAVEADRPHRRDVLSSLLWPEYSQHKANRNLSQALFKLRRAIGDRDAIPPFLLINPQTLQFNPAAAYTLDVTAFTTLLTGCDNHKHHGVDLCDPCLTQCRQAINLYRGPFLEGFSISDSSTFSEWATLNRERLHRLAMQTFHRLVCCHRARGQYEPAIKFAWQWVALDPWEEEAHRQLMYLLAISGQRTAALSQYEACRRLLVDELGLEPAEKTTRLYQQIRAGILGRGAEGQRSRGEIFSSPPVLPSSPAPASLPPLLPSTSRSSTPQVPFVARDDELAQLDQFLNTALAGRGQVVFVTGEAGQGKTFLLQEFARRAQAAHPPLIVADGSSSAPAGMGDPYLPFREVLALLAGDLEARWSAVGAVSQEQASRLWQLLPGLVQVLLDVGPDLVNTFLPGAVLLKRARAFAPGGAAWLDQLEELVERKTAISTASNLQQSALFKQYTRVLATLSSRTPLLLLLDDLQWIDAGSARLLFHLGRRIAGSRIMLVGAYRPVEIAWSRPTSPPFAGGIEGGQDRHPLGPVVNEFKRYFGNIEVNLDRAAGYHFVEAWLDTQPNRLGEAFRQTLYHQTQGHPLFTVELLRAMQERGDLIRNEHGHWIEGSALDWDTLPVRVEAVIAERMAQLPQPLHDTLTVASVEGETFTAEIMARVERVDEQEMIQQLDDKLARTYRLVQAGGARRVDGQCLSLYRFRHTLFQKYLYNDLSPAARAHLHQAVGTTLETLYGQETAEVAVQLAWHFQQAGLVEKAITYLQQAGEQAAHRSANIEAVGHLKQGLMLLRTLPDTPARDRQELGLQMALGTSLIASRGFGDAAEVETYFQKAIEIARQQEAKSLELRAVMSLCRLRQTQGVPDSIAEARQMLEEIYGWFTEGFDTVDLIEAKTLLEELS